MTSPTDKDESLRKPEKGARWGQDRRLEFIDFRLLWEGRINRSDLTDFFGISVPQASIDLARYIELAPQNVVYDKSEKVYAASSDFYPVLTSSEATHYLNQMLAVRFEMMSPAMSFLGWYPPFDAVLSPSRKISPGILFGILQAIRYKLAIEVEYQSMSRPNPTKRIISPHAIAYDGLRWHCRAFCHEHLGFRDFVLARIARITGDGESTADPATDEQWHTLVSLVLAPHPELPEGTRRSIELDYGMKRGQVIIQSRHALLFYLLRRLRLDIADLQSAKAQQIVLLNREELAPYIEAS